MKELAVKFLTLKFFNEPFDNYIRLTNEHFWKIHKLVILPIVYYISVDCFEFVENIFTIYNQDLSYKYMQLSFFLIHNLIRFSNYNN